MIQYNSSKTDEMDYQVRTLRNVRLLNDDEVVMFVGCDDVIKLRKVPREIAVEGHPSASVLVTDGRRLEGELCFTDSVGSCGVMTGSGAEFVSFSMLEEIDVRGELGVRCDFSWDSLRRVSLSGVRRITAGSFRFCSNLVDVKLSQELEVIENRAFCWCQ
jgi:hypothetical protein